MSKDKEVKTNAMRILDRNKVKYKVNTYECDEFIDGMQIVEKLNLKPEQVYKTLVTTGKTGNHYVFVIPIEAEIDFAIPIAEELDMKKAAKSVGEKSVEMLHVKDINSVTGYIRGGCTPLGMKKQYMTVVDSSAEQFEEIIISGGRIGSQIMLSPKDLIKVTRGKFESITMSE